MNRLYFLIFIEVLILTGTLIFNYSSQLFVVYENSLEAQIQNSFQNINFGKMSQAGESRGSKEISLLFTGDIMLSRGVGKQIEHHENPNYPFLKMADTLNSADLAIGNLESPISKRGENQGSIYSFRAEPSVAEGLNFAGFKILNLANNHIMDWGRIALEDTIDNLENNGINWIGAGRNEKEANGPLIVNIKGSKIAFLGFTNLYPKSMEAKNKNPGISHFDIKKIKEQIRRIKDDNQADLVIVSFHWGDEYEKKSNAGQQGIAHELIDAGADLIVGHHPHVVQDIERYKGKYIAYSLGNFVFDQDFSEETNKGLMLKVLAEGKIITKVEPIEIKILRLYQPDLAE